MKINEIVNDISNKVGTYINNIKEEQIMIDKLVNDSKSFLLDKEITLNEESYNEGNVYEYMDMCAYFGLKQAKIIDSLIPLNETVLKIIDIMQKKDYKEYLIILTDKRIIVMDSNKYAEYSYEDIKSFSLIKKGFMSQIVEFNGIIMDMNAYYEEVNTAYKIVSNKSFRDYSIDEARRYLCGIKPVYQKLNKIRSGISIDENKAIVFHDRKEKNYLCKYEDIADYEVLEDTTVVMEKSDNNNSTAIKNTKVECYTMSLRITTTSEKVFEITILPVATFNKAYHHSETVYIKSYNFAKEIIQKLESLKK